MVMYNGDVSINHVFIHTYTQQMQLAQSRFNMTSMLNAYYQTCCMVLYSLNRIVWKIIKNTVTQIKIDRLNS